jgi:hypothetical protein
MGIAHSNVCANPINHAWDENPLNAAECWKPSHLSHGIHTCRIAPHERMAFVILDHTSQPLVRTDSADPGTPGAYEKLADTPACTSG